MEEKIFLDDDNVEFHETLADAAAEQGEKIDTSIDGAEMIVRMKAAMAKMDSEDAALLRLRYGFDDEPKKLAEIARMTGRTISSIQKQQIRAEKTLRKIMDEIMNE